MIFISRCHLNQRHAYLILVPHTAISRKVVGKMCTRQSRKVIWDMINTLFLTTVPSNLLLLLSFSTRKHISTAFRTNYFRFL